MPHAIGLAEETFAVCVINDPDGKLKGCVDTSTALKQVGLGTGGQTPIQLRHDDYPTEIGLAYLLYDHPNAKVSICLPVEQNLRGLGFTEGYEGEDPKPGEWRWHFGCLSDDPGVIHVGGGHPCLV